MIPVSMNSAVPYQTFESRPSFTVLKTAAAALVAIAGLTVFAASLSMAAGEGMLGSMLLLGGVLAFAMLALSSGGRSYLAYEYGYLPHSYHSHVFDHSPRITHVVHRPLVEETPIYSSRGTAHLGGERVRVGGGHHARPVFSGAPFRPSGRFDGERVRVGTRR